MTKVLRAELKSLRALKRRAEQELADAHARWREAMSRRDSIGRGNAYSVIGALKRVLEPGERKRDP